MIILTDKTIVIPVGISPNYSGVNKPSLEDKSVEITENGDYSYTADEAYYGIGNFNVKVNVEIPVESEKTVSPSFDEDITVLPSEGFDAMSSVIVKKAEANLQDKTVDKASTSEIVLTADEGYQGLGTVTVAPIKTTSVTADPSTNVQDVNANTEENEYITSVTVNPVTSSIDSNIVPRNIAKGVSILGVEGTLEAGSTPGTPTEAYAIRQEYNNGYNLVYPINVRLTTDSWVSFDFAMSEQALETYNMPILGVSDNSLKLAIEQGRLKLNIGDSQIDIDYKLDTARHNISFGFAGVVDPANEIFSFKVEIDNVEMYNGYVTAPNFNLPLFLFGCPYEYHGTYEDYELLGGVTFLLNEIYIYQSTEYFYIFGLKVYNANSLLQRYLIRDYEPAIDADQKPCLLEKLSNEYEYPSLGKFMYVAVPTAVPNEIANSDYGGETPQQCYIKPSAGAIVPTDIKLTPTTRIVMYLGDTGTFDEVSADATEEEILKSRVMLGAQPNLLISAYDENDVRRGLPGYAESHSMSTDDLLWQITGCIGIYFGGSSNILYSTSDTDGNSTQYVFGNDKLCFGYDVVDEVPDSDSDSLNKILTTNYYDETSSFNKKAVSPTYSQFNNEMNTPICFFGNYNETAMKPDEVITLGYQEALSQIGYTTGIRYEIKRIEIYDRDSDGSISRKHMLLPATNVEGVNFLKDVVTGSSYYPFNGTLDVIYGTPIQDNESDTPKPTILTDTYIKPSAGAIVPTDIKLPALHGVKMYIKDIDAFDEQLDSTITGQAALNIVKDRVMLGAQPDLIAPFNHLDYERNLPRLPISDETTAFLGDSSIAFFHRCGDVDAIMYSAITEYGLDHGGSPQAIPSLNGEHIIDFGFKYHKLNRLWKYCGVDNQGRAIQLYHTDVEPVNNNKMAPLCIFGTYNYVEGKTPDDVIALGYQQALHEIGFKTGVRYAVKRIDIEEYSTDTGEATAEPVATLHSLVPARGSNGTICLYDTITEKSYYPYNGTLDVYTSPVEPEPEPEPPVPPTILTDTYVKPSAGAIVPTDIKFTSLTKVKMYVKNFSNFDMNASRDSRPMIGAQPNFIVSASIDSNNKTSIYFNGGGNVLRSTDGKTPQTFNPTTAQLITVGYRPKDINNINMDNDKRMLKIINFGRYTTNMIFKEVGPTSTSIYKFVDGQARTPICIFGNYNNSESMTPDDVIALGYENALSQIGYVTGVRYGVRRIDITVYNADGSETTTHSLVPARDTNNTICLYDTVANKSYYPFHGTLDII